MVFAEFDRRARREGAHRTKLIVQMMTTFAYASLGIAIADPLFKDAPLEPGNVAAFLFGLVCASLALYLVPKGEYDGQL